MSVGYLPNYYFTYSALDRKYDIIEKFCDSEWDFAKGQLNDRSSKISNNAILLAEKVKIELDIELYPLIVKMARKGYTHDGQVISEMYGRGWGNTFKLDLPVRVYLKKKARLTTYFYDGNKYITVRVGK